MKYGFVCRSLLDLVLRKSYIRFTFSEKGNKKKKSLFYESRKKKYNKTTKQNKNMDALCFA